MRGAGKSRSRSPTPSQRTPPSPREGDTPQSPRGRGGKGTAGAQGGKWVHEWVCRWPGGG
eukprot:12908736-Prorocentrum_lima.AAC.1